MSNRMELLENFAEETDNRGLGWRIYFLKYLGSDQENNGIVNPFDLLNDFDEDEIIEVEFFDDHADIVINGGDEITVYPEEYSVDKFGQRAANQESPDCYWYVYDSGFSLVPDELTTSPQLDENKLSDWLQEHYPGEFSDVSIEYTGDSETYHTYKPGLSQEHLESRFFEAARALGWTWEED